MSKNKNAIITLIVVAIIIGIGGIMMFHANANSYHKYTTANDVNMLSSQIIENSDTKKLTILMNYKTGCTDCESVHDKIINQIKETKASPKFHFVMVDSKNEAIRKYLLSHGVINTPTVVVLNNGRVVEQYSGDNTVKLNRLLQAQDMDTGHKLTLTYNANAKIENDELKTKQILPINEHPNLNYAQLSQSK